MKEHGESAPRGLLHPAPLSPHLSPPSEKMLRDQELHHLVTSSIPSPPYVGHHTGLGLMNAQAAAAGLVLDPIYSTHLIASLMAANAAAATQAPARFQLPIPLPLALNSAAHHNPLQPHLHRNLFHLSGAAPGAALLPTTLAPGNLDFFSTWVTTQPSDDKKITSTTSSTPSSVPSPIAIPTNKKTNRKKSSSKPNNPVTIKNEKNAAPKQSKRSHKKPINSSLLLTLSDQVTSSENDLPMLKDAKLLITGDKEPMMTINPDIKPFIFLDKSSSPPAPVTPKAKKTSDSPKVTSPSGARDKVFTCPTCHRGFGYKHVLQNHERTHTGEKPFECGICQKKFTRDHHLKTHMRLHTGEKPYQCTHCDRQFVQVANLRRHLRVHTGERPYQCETCNCRFSDSNQLKAHLLIHEDKKPYNCGGCGQHFRRKHHLAHHKCVSSPDDRDTTSMSSGSPPQLVTPSSTGSSREGAKRGRKSRETRRIIRLEGMGSDQQPEQDHPEDLSMSGGLRVRHFSGSSSVTPSSTPSPRGPGLVLCSTRPYSSSSSFEEPPDLYASDEDLRAADSSTNVKTENESSSMSD